MRWRRLTDGATEIQISRYALTMHNKHHMWNTLRTYILILASSRNDRFEIFLALPALSFDTAAWKDLLNILTRAVSLSTIALLSSQTNDGS